MDTFDLRWSKTAATFYTDGWRCRIVWRGRSGIGGSIENDLQCKQRVADSLGGAPYLLAALKARGHGHLATQIEDLVAVPAATVLRAPRPSARVDPGRGRDSARLAAWLNLLEGSTHSAKTNNRRAKIWQPIGELGDATLLLKVPANGAADRPAHGAAQKRQQDWVLKRTWPQAQRKAQYVVAADLKGILSHLGEVEECRSSAFVESLLRACESLPHPQLAAAATAWHELKDSPQPH